MTQIPHLASPMVIATTGAHVDEQDSTTEIQACVRNIVSCPHGFRTDLPDFGIPELAYQTLPIDTDQLKHAISKYEPRAAHSTVTATAPVDSWDQRIEVDIA